MNNMIAYVLISLLATAGSETTYVFRCPEKFTNIMDSCFYFENYTMLPYTNWDSARDFCFDLGSDLAIINDCTLFKYVVRHIHINSEYEVPDMRNYWIGGTDRGDEGTWVWIDGTPITMGVPFWGSAAGVNEPGITEKQNCLSMYKDDRYYFHDAKCTGAGYPLCQAVTY